MLLQQDKECYSVFIKLGLIRVQGNYDHLQVNDCDKPYCLLLCEAVCHYLYPAVAPVSYNNVSVSIYSHSCGSVKLAISFPVRPKLKEELPIRTEDLREKQKITITHIKPCTMNRG